MHWLFANYKWLFDGIGALVIIGVVGYLLRRFMRAPEPAYHLEQPRQEKTDGRAGLKAEVSQVRSERFNPNIQMTGAGVASVSERERGVWKEDVQGTERAVLIQFTNETRPGSQNVEGLVKAELVYKNEAEVLRILGSWLNSGSDHMEFRVDQSHKLMVGIQYAQMFTVIGRRHLYEQGRFTIEIESHDLPVFQTVRVKLTNANTGDFLYEGEFVVTLNPLGIVATDL
jgi:hypothetical protein